MDLRCALSGLGNELYGSGNKIYGLGKSWGIGGMTRGISEMDLGKSCPADFTLKSPLGGIRRYI